MRRANCLDKRGLIEFAEDCERINIDEISISPEEIFSLINLGAFIVSLDKRNQAGFYQEIEYRGHIFSARNEKSEYNPLAN